MATRDIPHPPHLRRAVRRARAIEWFTIVYMVSLVVVVGIAMGSSQAMKTVWIEDALGLIPPVAFLVAGRVSRRPPDRDYPDGYHRAKEIAFLCGAVALLGVGLFLIVDGAMVLLRREHPIIGSTDLFGREIWDGWIMMAALAYSGIPTVVLGRIKEPLARELHDKALYTDAAMNRADWKTAGAAVLGIAGIYFGLWWADAAAALIISIDICHDGARNLRHSIGDLMDRMPRTVDRGEEDPLVARLRREIHRVPWIADHELRLREHGDLLAGEIILVPRSEQISLERLDSLTGWLRGLDWRLRDILLVPIETRRDTRAPGSKIA
jgi:cation diffusion facilitator family transporter